MKKIIQIFRFEKWNNHHKIFSKINTIQNHHHQIVSSIEWREENRAQFVSIDEKKKSKNSIDQILFIFIDQNDVEIIKSSNASNIKSSIGRTLSRGKGGGLYAHMMKIMLISKDYLTTKLWKI